MGWNPKKCSYPLKPSKSAQTLKKRSGWQKVYPTKGLPEKSATMESLGLNSVGLINNITGHQVLGIHEAPVPCRAYN